MFTIIILINESKIFDSFFLYCKHNCHSSSLVSCIAFSIHNEVHSEQAMTKIIIEMEKVKILEKLLEMNVGPDDIHDARDIYRLSSAFLCNLLDHVYVNFDYLNDNITRHLIR